MRIRKEIKKNAKKVLKRNYWRSVAVAFFVAFMLGYLNLTTPITVHKNISTIATNNIPILNSINSDIANETLEKLTNIKTNITNYKPTKGLLANIFNNITASKSFIFGLLNSFNQLVFHDHIWESIIILIGAALSFLYWALIQNVLNVGESRFFLENRNYSKTNFKRVLLPFRIKKLKNTIITMTYVFIKEFLWFFTIIGGFIKHYAYKMVPYIIAENPGIEYKEAIELSEKMMQGHKWELCKLDLSFLGWHLLDILTFHIIGIIYVTPYKKCCLAEYYMNIRNLAKKNNIKNSELLKDTYLEIEGEKYPSEKYLYEEKKYKWLNTDYNQDYSILSLILMFFQASIIGWIWEVGLHLFQYGNFVNRGTLHGPWLQIYGFGSIFLLILLKKWRNNPALTFILSMIVCGTIEYFTGWYLEIFKNAKWWDYNGFFLNLHGRICLEGLIAFAIGGCLFIYFLAPLFESIYNKISKKVKIILCIILTILFTIDFIYSSKYPNTGEGITTDYQTKNIIIESQL